MMPRFATAADADLVTSICTHPEVMKWTHADGAPPFDPTPWLHPTNMVVLVESGCFLSNWLGDQTFEVHTNILPGGRGKDAVLSGTLALLLAFVRSNAETLVTKVPGNNRPARWFARELGFTWMYSQAERWVQNGKAFDVDFFRLTVDEWILQGHLAQVGEAFHQELVDNGIEVDHPHDPVHDAYVGAACTMIQGGKAVKGIKLYNRWARATGYVPITVKSFEPLVLDLGSFIINLKSGLFRFEKKGN